MRRLILGLVVGCIAVLPVIAASPDDGMRIRRSANVDRAVYNSPSYGRPSAGNQSESDFSAFQTAPSPSAGFVLNINQAPPRQGTVRQVPQPFTSANFQKEGGEVFVKQLAPRDLNLLSSRDIILLIDRSGSMSEEDCPAPRGGFGFLSRISGEPYDVSRWNWCASELMTMARMAAGALRQGMRVVMFATDDTAYERVRLEQIPQIFGVNHPAGSTNAAAALKKQLDWYFTNKANHQGQSSPVVIAVITDGLPNNARALKKAIVEATLAMERPDEIAITFLQVGRDRSGVNLVHELDDDLVRQGARFDIVDCKDFGDLLNAGLGRALADAISESGRVTGR